MSLAAPDSAAGAAAVPSDVPMDRGSSSFNETCKTGVAERITARSMKFSNITRPMIRLQ